MQPSRSNAADIHPGTLAHRFEPLEYGDVFRGVVRGCHVYNVRLVKPAVLRVLCGFVVCFSTIVPRRSAGAAEPVVSEDAPVPGGLAAFSQLASIDPVPDRGRFMSEVTRILLQNDPQRSPEILAARLRSRASAP